MIYFLKHVVKPLVVCKPQIDVPVIPVFMSKVEQVERDVEGKIQQATAEELRQRDWKNQVTGAKEAIRELKARWLLTEGGD